MTTASISLSRGCERAGTRAAALARLRARIADGGLGRKRPVRVLAELAWHVTLACAGVLIFFGADGVAGRAIGLLLSTLGSMGVGTNTHTSSHYATSEKRWLNEALTFFGYPFLLGLSASFWWRKHVVVHHPSPNVIGVDEDADFAPWLALLERDVRAAGPLRRFYYTRLQWWLFPLLLAGNGFNMQRAGWRHLVSCLASRSQRRPAHWIDLGCLLLHLGVNLGVPLLFVGASEAMAGYALRIVLMGYAMFAVLGPGHLPAEAARLSPEARDTDYLLLQTATTVNFRTGPMGRLLCSGLEYQIEHHLFPSLSHVHYPSVAPLVRDFCRIHSLPYRTHSWPVAIWKSWAVLRTPRPMHNDVTRVRLAGE